MRDLCLLSLSAIGSGGTGDAGQRIRDEILHIQSKNNAKGGMMEQWHQKLHNNTSPDDVVICEALLAYLRADLVWHMKGVGGWVGWVVCVCGYTPLSLFLNHSTALCQCVHDNRRHIGQHT